MSTNSLFTQIRIARMEKDSLRAIASVKVLDAVYLTGLRVIEGKHGLFVSMPNRKTNGGEYQDIYFPASKEMRNELTRVILESYEKQAANPSPRPAASAAEPALAGAF